LAPTPSASAARCHGLVASPSPPAGAVVSATNRCTAVAIAAASSEFGLPAMLKAYSTAQFSRSGNPGSRLTLLSEGIDQALSFDGDFAAAGFTELRP
jgi:hypothetical protein